MVNSMKKLITICLAAIFFIFIFAPQVLQAQESVEVNFFYSPTCPHCHKEQKFLDELEEKYGSQIKVNRFNIYEKENVERLEMLYNQYEVASELWGLVPITFTGEQAFVGFDDKIGQDIKTCIIEICMNGHLPAVESQKSIYTLPFIGEINLNSYSPLALSIILGGLDGFNACAMAALAFLLAVLISTGVRKRIILIGGTFIFVSGLVYFIFISAWLNVFLFLGHIKFITILVGVIIVVFAVIMLKDYAKGVVCKICRIDPKGDAGLLTKWQRKLFVSMEKLTSLEVSLPIALVGVAVVAAGVNMIELACSLGLPLAFTKMLTSQNMPTAFYYFYLLVYIFFYMLDDFIIFLIAVFTLRITGVSDKYLKAVKLVSGILLLALGLIILFRPAILMLG